MLTVEKLSKTYSSGFFKKRHFTAIDEISFTIFPNQTLGLIGESGCGKSTLARTLLGLIPPSSGKVFFKDQELTSACGTELRKLHGKMQIIFQHPESALNPRLKIYDSLLEPMRIQHLLHDPKEDREHILDVLQQVGLDEEHLSRYPHELSGGQIQRVVLARILSIKPEFVVADEPTSMLDVSVQAQVLQILKDIQAKRHMPFLFISHDLELVQWMSDRIAVMHQGRIVEIGPAEEICNHPQHPYTVQLVESFNLFQEKGWAKKIGSVSHIKNTPEGCHYAPFCPKASSVCTEKPPLRSIAQGHGIACWQA